MRGGSNSSSGQWPDDQGQDALQGDQLRGKTLVIVGYGGIGREIARLAAAHGLRVVAVKADPSVRADDGFRVPGTGDPDGTIPDRIVGIDALREAAAEADFLSITLPLTERSRGIVSREVLAALPGHAWIINTGTRPGRRRGGPGRGARREPDRRCRPRRVRRGAAPAGEPVLEPAQRRDHAARVGRDHGAPRPAHQREPAALRRR